MPSTSGYAIHLKPLIHVYIKSYADYLLNLSASPVLTNTLSTNTIPTSNHGKLNANEPMNTMIPAVITSVRILPITSPISSLLGLFRLALSIHLIILSPFS